MAVYESLKLKKNFIKLLIFALIIILAAYLIKVIQIERILNFQALKGFVESYGWMAPIIFIGILSLAPVFFIPVSPFPLAGGLLFGPFWGSIYAYCAALFSSIIIFFLSRYLGRGFLENILAGKLKKADEFTHDYGLTTALLIRFSGIPFSLQCYTAGLSRMKFNAYLVGSLIGIAPWTIALSVMGDSLTSHNLLLLSAALGCLIMINIAFLTWWKRKKKDNSPSDADSV